jgi:hypothetical protein
MACRQHAGSLLPTKRFAASDLRPAQPLPEPPPSDDSRTVNHVAQAHFAAQDARMNRLAKVLRFTYGGVLLVSLFKLVVHRNLLFVPMVIISWFCFWLTTTIKM